MHLLFCFLFWVVVVVVIVVVGSLAQKHAREGLFRSLRTGIRSRGSYMHDVLKQEPVT